MTDRETDVFISGAGPAGLTCAILLQRAGIRVEVADHYSRREVLEQSRAGLIDHLTYDVIVKAGLAPSITSEAVIHDSCEFRRPGASHVWKYSERIGNEGRNYMFQQRSLVRDLLRTFLAEGGNVQHQTRVKSVRDEGEQCVSELQSVVTGDVRGLRSRFVIGADGRHSVVRESMKDPIVHHKDWGCRALAVYADAPPSTDIIVYAAHPDGFAGHMIRTSTQSRYYLEIAPDEEATDWPDERIWSELHKRFERQGWQLIEGPITQKGVVAMDSLLCETMREGNLFLAGDSAHITTFLGARGLNSAMHDAELLCEKIIGFWNSGEDSVLDEYATTRLPHIWKNQWLCETFLRLMFTSDDPFLEGKKALWQAELERDSPFARDFAETYCGLNVYPGRLAEPQNEPGVPEAADEEDRKQKPRFFWQIRLWTM